MTAGIDICTYVDTVPAPTVRRRRRGPGAALRGLALLLVVLACAPAAALTAVPRTFSDLVDRADLILVGTVAELEGTWSADRRIIYTLVRLTDLEVIKGTISTVPYELRMPGGVIGDVAQDYPGMPRLEQGGRYVLFIRGNRRDFFPLVGVYQGLYRVLTDADGRQRVLRADEHEAPAVQALSRPAPPTLEEFTGSIRARLSTAPAGPAP